MTRMYSAGEVVRLSGLSFRNLDYWVRMRILKARHNGKGTGVHRQFALTEVHTAAALAKLGKNMDLSIKRKVAEEVRAAKGSGPIWVRLGPCVSLCIDMTAILVEVQERMDGRL